MNKDPYSVLGISRNATDDEVKKAYRELAKKYHPDNYADSPLADLVEEKMKEVNEAYEAIQKERAGGGGSRYSSYQSSGITSFPEVRRLINEGKFQDAEILIDSAPSSDRGAEWNFLKGVLLLKRGDYFDGQKYIETACYLDPGNGEYRSFRDNMRQNSGYNGGPFSAGAGENDFCNLCAEMMLCNILCNCCGRGC